MKLSRPAPLLANRLAAGATVACGLALGLAAPPAAALGFGEPVVSSALGQPLRMRIPLRVDPDMDLTSQCVRLLGNAGGDAIPTMTMAMARITIERRGEERILRIDSLYPVNEPVMRVSVEAGCAQHARREFMLLLDPPDTLPQIALNSPTADAPAVPAPQVSVAGTPTPLPGAGPAQDAAAPVGAASPALPGNAPPPAGPVTDATGAPPASGATGADIELGAASIVARVGEALSMQIPVTGSGAASLDAGCVHLAGAWNGEGAPVLSQARLTVVHNGLDTLIEMQTAHAVTEPALRVIVEAGCATAARREYAVLLDKPLPKSEAAVATTPPAPPPPPAPIASPPAPASAPATAAGPVAATQAAAQVPAPAVRAKPKPRRPLAPPAPAALAVAPAQAPAPAPAAPTPAPTQPAAAKPKAAPAADHLVLAAPSEPADPAAQRLAEMDKRIADLTKEVTELRTQLVAERLKAAEAAEAAQAQQQRLGAGWIVAILALIGLGVAGLLSWQRKRNALPWEKTSWEATNSVIAAPENTRMPAAAPVPADPRPAAAPSAASGAAASGAASAGSRVAASAMSTPAAKPAATPRPTPGAPLAVPPQPAIRPLASFQELNDANSTITPPHGGPHTTIEVTELHADDPELEKMHTVFLEPGNLDTPPPPPPPAPGASNTRVPGPVPNTSASLREDIGRPTRPLSPITQMPPMPSPTIVAPDQRHGAFTFDEGPYTQTPTMLVLDLDLTTRALPPEDAEAAKLAEKTKDAKDGKGEKT